MSAGGIPVTVVAAGGAPVTPVGLSADMVLATGDVSVQEALDAKQPLDADLTAIAALATTSFGRSLLTMASAQSARTALKVPGFDGYSSGGFYIADGVGVPVAGTAGSANTIYFHPFILLGDVTVDSLVARVATAAASGNFQMALYAAAATTRLPTGAVLYSSASQTTASAATIEDTGPSLALTSGLYWAAVNKDTSAATATFLSNSSSGFRTAQRIPSQSAATLMPSNGVTLPGFSKSQTFNTWPTLTGSFATDSLAAVAGGTVPVVGFKAA